MSSDCKRSPPPHWQAKNGEALPPNSLPRPQRAPQTPSKPAAGGGAAGEREEVEQKAVLAVQCSLLKILSKTLATLQRFTPDCCQILLDQVSTSPGPRQHLLHPELGPWLAFRSLFAVSPWLTLPPLISL